MRRRHLLPMLGACLISPLENAMARPILSRVTLLTAPLELGGNWAGSAPSDAAAVIDRARAACLTEVALLSDHQPEKIRVDDHSGSNPSIWLHTDNPTTGWIIVTVGIRDWCNLAYQFGHELGHVFCNSWEPNSAPQRPCQWIEEALVEAFSLRGLALLADGWERAPPFPNDSAYAAYLRSYRETILADYQAIAREQGVPAGFGAWFRRHKAFFKQEGGLDSARGAVPTMLSLLEGDAGMIADMGMLNRWPERSGVPVHEYLNLWQKSCSELNAPGQLPLRLRELLDGP